MKWRKLVSGNSVPPVARPLHACSVVGDDMFVHGGRTGLRVYDRSMHTFNFESNRWSRCDVTYSGRQEDMGKAPALAGHTLTEHGGKLYAFGGRKSLFNYSSDVYVFDAHHTMSLLSASGPHPAPRQGHVAVARGNRLYVHGGTDGSERYSDTHYLDLDAMEWHAVPSSGAAPQLEGHCAAGHGSDWYVFGGFDGKRMNEYVWKFSFETHAWTNTKMKMKPRAYHSSAVVGERVYMFGGMNVNGMLGDTVAFDLAGGSWANLKLSGGDAIAARQGHCSVARGSKVYVFGGSSSAAGRVVQYNDMFVLDTAPRGDPDGEKPLSEKIEEAIAAVEREVLVLKPASEEEYVAAVKELKAKVLGEADAQELGNLSEKAKRWVEIGELYRLMTGYRSVIDGIASPASFRISDFSDSRKRYASLCGELGKAVKRLRESLSDLKGREAECARLEEERRRIEMAYRESKKRVRLLEGSVASDRGKLREMEVAREAVDREARKCHDAMRRLDERLYLEIGERNSFGKTEAGILKEIEDVTAQMSATKSKISRLGELIAFKAKDLSLAKDLEAQYREMHDLGLKLKEAWKDRVKITREYHLLKGKFVETMKSTPGFEIPAVQRELVDESGWIEDIIGKFAEMQQRKKSDLEGELEGLERELKAETLKYNEYEKRVSKLNSELSYLQSKMSNYKSGESKISAERKLLDSAYREARKRSEAAEVDIKKLKFSISDKETELSKSKSEAEERSRAARKIESGASGRLDLARAQMQLRESYESATRMISEARELYRELDSMLNDISVRSRDYDEKAKGISDVRSKLVRMVSDADAELFSCREERNKMSKEVDATKAERRTLIKELERCKRANKK